MDIDKIKRDRAVSKRRMWKNHIKRAYGLTTEQYHRMLTEQNYVCAICKNKEDNLRNLVVDHNHATNKVRGLLCYRCNTLLGCAKEQETTLQNAVDYLRKHG